MTQPNEVPTLNFSHVLILNVFINMFIIDKCVTMESKKACVRVQPDEDELKISFYHNGRRNFNRMKNESLEKTLQRISLKLQPKTKEKKKKVAGEENSTENIFCCVLDGNIEVCKELTNEKSFVDGRVLRINDNYYDLYVNPPTVTKLVLPTYIMAGFPTIPNVKFESASLKKSKFNWFKSSSSGNDVADWISVGEGSSYIPDVRDVDYYLKCLCYPVNGSNTGPFSEEVISEEPVKAGPGICLFDQRHLYTPKYLPTYGAEFRIITYNILANVFADTDYARNVLYPFCTPYAIKSDYRRQLLFKELIGYHADLICLQECSLHEYENYLYSWMSLNNYGGFLKLKGGEMSEGEAFFFRNDRYQHIEDISISVEDALLLQSNESLLEKMRCIPPLLENIQSKKAIGQIHILKEKHGEQRVLCVVNTHLYYKRYSVNVRLLQVVILLNYLSEILQSHVEKNISVIVSGDLNSLRGDPLLQYLLGEKIKEDHPVWSSCENPEENGLCMDLECPLQLNLLSGFPDFTTYVPHCKATLDYIFGDCTIEKNGFVPLPCASDIDIYTGLPCVVYPSDHLAVVLDLKWK